MILLTASARHGKTYIHIAQAGSPYLNPALQLRQFAEEHGIRILNVAGSLTGFVAVIVHRSDTLA